ncbi:hypothetical protein [Plebeiibacterium sediminum]|uniref:Uncharacterized protein n=1 Tax=Plebeiibacterium sediminum TaxID=2992112 RepID=A0AAE3SIN9_9BACT|nr:hypothetical protein [Plebeiobacterium sediminum]MCW3789423.1 hypothetical protein [Plebeiobacterium sediminum]
MSAKSNISISIQEVKETAFSLKPFPEELHEVQFGKNLSFGMAFQFGIVKEKEIFKFQTNIKYLITNIEEPLIEFSNEITFHVLGLSSVIKETEDGTAEIKDDFIATIAGVCIGTSRGMLAVNTKGTEWSKYPLPILNPQQVVKEMNKPPKN